MLAVNRRNLESIFIFVFVVLNVEGWVRSTFLINENQTLKLFSSKLFQNSARSKLP